ncbi:MAG: pre-toxin TG domain-containing protein [Bdellovibrionia bacterium]
MNQIIQTKTKKTVIGLLALIHLLLMVSNLPCAFAGKDYPTSSNSNGDFPGKSHCPSCEKPARPPAVYDLDDTHSWRKNYEIACEWWKHRQETHSDAVEELNLNDEMARFGGALFFSEKTADPNPTHHQIAPERVPLPDVKKVAKPIEQESQAHQKRTQRATEEQEKEKKSHEVCLKDLAQSFQNQKQFFEKTKAIQETIREHLSSINPKEANALNRAMTRWDYRKAGPEMIAAACTAENLAQATAYSEQKASETLLSAHEIAKEALGLSLHELTSAAKALTRPSDLESIAHSLEYADMAREIALTLVDVGTSVAPGVSTARDAYELITGKNLITGNELSDFDRTLAGVNLASLGVGNFTCGTLKVAEKIGHLAAGNHRIGAIEHGLKPSVRAAEQILESSIVPRGAKNRATDEVFLKERRDAI